MSEATKKCPKCQGEISMAAKKCKHCQSDLRNWFVRHIVLTIIIGIFLLMGVGCVGCVGLIANETDDDGDEKQEEKPSENSEDKKNSENSNEKKDEPKEEIIEITANELYEAYDNNEIKADKDYKGKTAIVSGTVASIDKIFGSTSIRLKGDSLGILNIDCNMKDSEEDKIAELSQGQQVKLKGKIDGKEIEVTIKNCVIVE